MIRRILDALVYIEKAMPRYFPHIPKITGEILKLATFMTAQHFDRIRIVDIGAGYGYSTLWMYLGAEEAEIPSEVYAVEINSIRAEFIERIVEKYELNVRVINADAGEAIRRIQKPMHVVFIDAEKNRYGEFLKMVKPKLVGGSVVMAHNVVGFKEVMGDFLAEISGEEWRTTIFLYDPEGLSISILKTDII